MQITELRHLCTSNRIGVNSGCLDDKHHLLVFSLKSGGACYEIFYKNSDTPYKVKQVAGVRRSVTDDEFFAVGMVCASRLTKEVHKNLAVVSDYVSIASIIADELGFDDADDFLSMAVLMHRSSNTAEMHHHLSEMLLWEMQSTTPDDAQDDEIIDNIIERTIALSDSINTKNQQHN